MVSFSTPNIKPPSSTTAPPLHTCEPLRRTPFNRLFAALYMCALSALFYRHVINLLTSETKILSSLLLLADSVLAFQWAAVQSFRMRPVRRREFPENLEKVKNDEFPPPVDIFICTADPYKEPPMGVVNTALSVLAYDYPSEKLSVYVSDDGGSQLTLFAFMEAARFARHWLPFCRENEVQVRSPEAYFKGGYSCSDETQKIEALYEEMKGRVEDVIEKGKVGEEHLKSDQDRSLFTNWTPEFTRQHHPTLIQVLVDKIEMKDNVGHAMPNLIYVSREKSRSHHHNFKAGALNTLIRVSAAMTNAPIILTLDCDMFSNDPKTIWRALCYFEDPVIRPTLGYVQFPQIFSGLNNNDTYASENKRLFQINPLGLDGFCGPNYLGTNCFLQRRALFGAPSSHIHLKTHNIGPSRIVDKPLQSLDVLGLAHTVAAVDYEHQTLWGSKIGIRYGSLVEDFVTGFLLQCEGWRGIFCHPERPAFFGGSPIALVDILDQCKRWSIGALEVFFSKFNPLTYGIKSVGLFMGLGYSHYTFWPIWSIPLTIYAFVPQLALLNGISIFPKVDDSWFSIYIFLFVGAYGQDLLDFLLAKSNFRRWWNAQRMWMIWGVSCFLFGCAEYFLARLHISIPAFTVTSKIQEDDLNKRYEQGIYEFGVASPMFVPLSMAAIVNLVALCGGFVCTTIGGGDYKSLAMQMLICGFVVVNSWPVYEAMALRKDKGRLPTKTTVVVVFQVLGFCVLGSFLFKIRVSAAMTNAPIILALDCDFFSNDPRTIWRALCYFHDPVTKPTLGYVQFPQIFSELNKNDIYASEQKRLHQINTLGLDGFRGPNHVGTNCFFQRRAFFGGLSSPLDLEMPEISPTHIIAKPLQSPDIIALAHRVAAAKYEQQTLWGSKMGIRYGSLVEDYFSGYLLHCEGWRSIFCHPERPAFLGDSPVTLVDILGQCKRWSIGLLEALFSKFSPLTYGVKSMGLFMGLGYTYNAFWPMWSIPMIIYAFIPQLALLNGISIFPKISSFRGQANDPWFSLYIFLFTGAYGQDLLEFLLANSTIQRWWNAQRIWMLYSLSCFLFGGAEYFLSHLGISIPSFTITNKVQEDQLSKRYDQGTYEFGVASPMFIPMSMAAIVNLVALVVGVVWTSIGGRDCRELALQMLLCGFVIVNSWPLYEAMLLRKDRGRLPTKTTVVAAFHVLGLCVLGSFLLNVL